MMQATAGPAVALQQALSTGLLLGSAGQVLELLALTSQVERLLSNGATTLTIGQQNGSVLALYPDRGRVGLIGQIEYSPDQSFVISVSSSRDNQLFDNDPAMIERAVIDGQYWVPFTQSFLVTATNTDTTAPHALHVSVHWYQMSIDLWSKIQNAVVGPLADALAQLGNIT